MTPQRKLVYRFLMLPWVTQMEVVIKLDLMTEEVQEAGTDIERNTVIIRTARERGILAELWDAIRDTAYYQDGSLDENPFRELESFRGQDI